MILVYEIKQIPTKTFPPHPHPYPHHLTSILAFPPEQHSYLALISKCTLRPILLVLSAASTIRASWKIPADQPDGVYVVSVDEAGVSHHEKFGTPAAERRTSVNSAKLFPKPALFPRETYEISCPGYCTYPFLCLFPCTSSQNKNTDSTQTSTTQTPIGS